MQRRRMRVAAALLLLAAASFAVAFAITRAISADGGAPAAARPVYYGPPPSIPDLEPARNSPPSLGARAGR